MKLSEKLRIVAEWLESEENDLIVSADLGPRGRDEAVSQSPMRAALTHLSDALAVCKTPHKGLAFSTFVLSDDPTTEHLNAIQKTVREIAAQPCGRDPAVNKAATDVWQLAENLKKQQAQIPAPKTASAQANPLAGVAAVLGQALLAWAQKNQSDQDNAREAQKFGDTLSDIPERLRPEYLEKWARYIGSKHYGTDPAVNKAATDLWQAAANLAKQQAQVTAPKTASEEDRVLSIVAEALVSAADIIRTASEYVASEEPAVELPSEGELDEIAAVAAAFDESEDEMLQKQAGILDNILAVLSSVDLASNVYDEDARLEEVKKKYHDVRDKLHEDGGLDAAAEAVEKSDVMKEKRKVQYLSLKSRYCPDHAGISTIRVAENRVQCPLDHKMYDYANGYSLLDGTKVPGGDVANQGDNFVHNEGHLVFQNRADRLGQPDK